MASRRAVFIDRDGTLTEEVGYVGHRPTEGMAPWRLDCECRKPKPGLLLRAAAALGLDLTAAATIGGQAPDLEVAPHVGAHPVLVPPGYGRGEWEDRRAAFRVTPDHLPDDLLDAVAWFLGRAPAR